MAMHLPGALNARYSTTWATVPSPNGNPIPAMSYPGWKWGTFQDTRVTEFEGVTSIPRKSKTSKQRMRDRESLRTHG
jgi:hypothetical protein